MPETDTIVFLCHHKCASTFLRHLGGYLSQKLQLKCHTEVLSKLLPLGYEKYPEQLQRIVDAYDRVLNSDYQLLFHLNADTAVVDTLKERGSFKGIHMIRDPRDLMVSAYYWHQSGQILNNIGDNHWINDRYKKLAAAPDLEAGLIMELDFCSCYFDTFREWNFHHENILELRFELLASDSTNVIIEILTFLGIPFIHHFPFANETYPTPPNGQGEWLGKTGQPMIILEDLLTTNQYKYLSGGRHQGTVQQGHKYRKGLPGDWKNHFTPRVVDLFKQRYGDLLINLNYENSKDW